MYYGSGTVAHTASQWRHTHSAGSRRTLQRSAGRTSRPPSWKCDVTSKIGLRQSMRIYLKNNPAKFHPDPIWNDRALGFFEERHYNKMMMSSDMGSVPDPIINTVVLDDNIICQNLCRVGCITAKNSHSAFFDSQCMYVILARTTWCLTQDVDMLCRKSGARQRYSWFELTGGWAKLNPVC